MSAGYATKLSYRDDLGGQVGDPELLDTTEDIAAKIARLSEWVTLIYITLTLSFGREAASGIYRFPVVAAVTEQ